MRYWPAGVLVLSVYVTVSMVTMFFFFVFLFFSFARSHTDGQDLGSSQMYCLGQIRAVSMLCSEIKQGHLCLTVNRVQ